MAQQTRSRQSVLSDHEVAELARRYEAGESIALLAQEAGYTYPGLRGAMKRVGVVMRGRGPQTHLSDDEAAELARRYETGETVAELARDVGGYTYAGLHALLKRHGVTFRGRRGPSPKKVHVDDPRVQEALRLRRTGMGYVRASEAAGLASITFRRILVELGMDPQASWRGEAASNWNGGRTRNSDGYMLAQVAPDDPLAAEMRNTKGYALEHRLVLARELGRPLTKTETVHHLNGKGDDNRLENLQLRDGKHGKGVVRRCAECGSRRIVEERL